MPRICRVLLQLLALLGAAVGVQASNVAEGDVSAWRDNIVAVVQGVACDGLRSGPPSD